MIKFKYLILISLLLFLVNPCRSQTLIAVQNETSSTFFASLDSALTKAKSGDYIYLPGGSFTISVPIDKQLQIVGVGHNPDSCSITGISQIIGNIKIQNGSDHGSIVGVKISGTVSFETNPNDVRINYYLIERCNIGRTLTLATQSSNILVNECIIHGDVNGNNTQGFQMSKCIIDGNSIYGFNSNAYFTNNIFMGNPSYISYVYNCYFKNNIYLSSFQDMYYNYSYECRYNSFQNNLFNAGFSIKSTTGTNLFRNNIVGPVTSICKNQSGSVFDYKQDYHILDASPAHNAGTDGTDLGIYGTGSPWKEGSLPSNPHIQSKSISTVNGNLNVKIKVAAQDR